MLSSVVPRANSPVRFVLSHRVQKLRATIKRRRFVEATMVKLLFSVRVLRWGLSNLDNIGYLMDATSWMQTASIKMQIKTRLQWLLKKFENDEQLSRIYSHIHCSKVTWVTSIIISSYCLKIWGWKLLISSIMLRKICTSYGFGK